MDSPRVGVRLASLPRGDPRWPRCRCVIEGLEGQDEDLLFVRGGAIMRSLWGASDRNPNQTSWSKE